jgi:hypothetical protein
MPLHFSKERTMLTRTFAVALALGALLLLAFGAPVGAADDGSSKRLSLPSQVYKGTVDSVTLPREPGMHTRVVLRSGWGGVECWITPETRLYSGSLPVLWLNLSKGDRVEANVDEEGHAVWLTAR